jgi:hypothetical protein
MTIISTTRRILKDGTIKGTINVKDGRNRHSVRYERMPGGHMEQWGAPSEVLIRTYPTFERLCAQPE